jgi:hypothetical protein
MNIQIVKPQDQAKGEFDGGKITEQKPIELPTEVDYPLYRKPR